MTYLPGNILSFDNDEAIRVVRGEGKGVIAMS